MPDLYSLQGQAIGGNRAGSSPSGGGLSPVDIPNVGPGQTVSQAQSGSYYSDPGAAQSLISQILSGITESRGQLQQGIQNPAATPNYQAQLAAHQAQQRPQNLQQQQDVLDAARMQGALSNGSTGINMAKLIGQQGLNEGTYEANLGNSIVNQLIQSLLPQILQGPALMDAMKLQQQSQASNSQQFAPQSGGGGGGSSQPKPQQGQPQPQTDPYAALRAALLGSQQQPQQSSPYFTPQGSVGGIGGGGGQQGVPLGDVPYAPTNYFDPSQVAQGISSGSYQFEDPYANLYQTLGQMAPEGSVD